jgi:hypothetical protein
MQTQATKRALVIQTDGSYDYLDLPIGYPAFARSFLGEGYLEAVMVGECAFWFDEEGKYKALLRNRLATMLLHALGGRLGPGDYLAGPVAVTGVDRSDGEIDDIPDIRDDLNKVKAALRRGRGSGE